MSVRFRSSASSRRRFCSSAAEEAEKAECIEPEDELRRTSSIVERLLCIYQYQLDFRSWILWLIQCLARRQDAPLFGVGGCGPADARHDAVLVLSQLCRRHQFARQQGRVFVLECLQPLEQRRLHLQSLCPIVIQESVHSSACQQLPASHLQHHNVQLSALSCCFKVAEFLEFVSRDLVVFDTLHQWELRSNKKPRFVSLVTTWLDGYQPLFDADCSRNEVYLQVEELLEARVEARDQQQQAALRHAMRLL